MGAKGFKLGKILADKKQMSSFVDMLLLQIKGEQYCAFKLTPIDGFIVGLIYCNSGLLLDIFSEYGTTTSDNTLQQLEQCVTWLMNHEQDLIKDFKLYKTYYAGRT